MRFILILILLFGLGYSVFLHSQEKAVINIPSSPPQSPSPELLPPGINNTHIPLSLPDGFAISIFAKDLGDARVLQLDGNGRVLVSAPRQGRIIALSDKDGDGSADQKQTVISGLNRPHGFVFLPEDNSKLYISETDQVAEYTYDVTRGVATRNKILLDLPGGGNHFTRTIGFGPDGKMYISVGSTCNVCIERDSQRAAILQVNPDGTGEKIFATGLRNSVFFTWNYFDNRMWATEMGRDHLGDTTPPDEINIIEAEKYYGWPYCYGKKVHDDNFDKSQNANNLCEQSTPSIIDIPAHSAPLGLVFIPPVKGWPKEYWNNLLVAYHGSWNRSEPTGYKIVRYILDTHGKVLEEVDFISGWISGDTVLGRPVDILASAGGHIYISDDKAGIIYRMEWLGDAPIF